MMSGVGSYTLYIILENEFYTSEIIDPGSQQGVRHNWQ